MSLYVETVGYAGMDGTSSPIHTCIPDSHLHRVTYTRCRIDTTDSPDDEHMFARNMQIIEINIQGKELCVKLVIYKNQAQPNIPRDFSLDYTLFQKLFVLVGICPHKSYYCRQRLFEKFFYAINIWRIKVNCHVYHQLYICVCVLCVCVCVCVYIYICIYIYIYIYTGCNRRNVRDFGRVFLRSNYTDITQNTYTQSSMVTEILAREKCGLLWCLRTVLCQ